MRVLHLTNTINDAGNGITNVAVDLAIEQARSGHEVAVLSRGGSFAPLLVANGVELITAPVGKRDASSLLASRAAIARMTAGRAPDVLHAHTITPTALALSISKRHRPGLVATVHNEYQRGVGLMKYADLVVGVSKAVSESMIRRGAPAHRTHTILNGTVGTVRRGPMGPPALKLPGRSIVAVGSISKRKGSDILIEAFVSIAERFPDLNLYFVGTVDWVEVVQIAERSGFSDRIHFTGFTSMPSRYVEASELFVLPSRREPLGLAFLEAHEAGVAAIGTNVDGIPEVLDGGRAGLLVPPEDPAALANAMDSLLSAPTRRQELARAGRAFVEDKTVARMADAYERIYELMQ